jgi:signal transduction histidine kinase
MKFNYRLKHVAVAATIGLAILFGYRGYQCRKILLDLIVARKPFDGNIIAAMATYVGSPMVEGETSQLARISDEIRHTQRFTRVLISDQPGTFLSDNSDVVSTDIVSQKLVRDRLDYWVRTNDPELFNRGVRDGGSHLLIRRFQLKNKTFYIVLISNLDVLIKDAWIETVSTLIVIYLLAAGLVLVSLLSVITPVSMIGRSIALKQLVDIKAYWPLELIKLAEEFNSYLVESIESMETIRSTNQEVSALYTSLRHDILSNCKGTNDMLTMMVEAGFKPDEDYREIFDLAVSKAELAYLLCSNTGKLGEPLKIGKTSIVEVLESIGVMFSADNVAVKLPDEDYQVDIDKSVFTLKVLGNLVSNAIKYSHPPNEDIKVGIKAKKSSVVVYVQDNGDGLSLENIEQILSNYGSSARLNPDIPGTGTGLNTVQKILKDHGLSLKVSSKIGVGSLFSIELPIY